MLSVGFVSKKANDIANFFLRRKKKLRSILKRCPFLMYELRN